MLGHVDPYTPNRKKGLLVPLYSLIYTKDSAFYNYPPASNMISLTPLPLLEYPQIGIKTYLKNTPHTLFISHTPGGYIFKI
jgi:hypothetical protein